MVPSAISSIVTLMVLAAFAGVSLRQRERRDVWFLVLFGGAIAATAVWVWFSHWAQGLATALLFSVFAGLVAFLAAFAVSRETWRLSVLLAPYLLLVAILTVLSEQTVAGAPAIGHLSIWLYLHIGSSILAYGVLTVAATASIAILIQERALKSRRRTALSVRLPSIAEAERLELASLCFAEIVLGLGIVFGMAAEHATSGMLLVLNHKSVLSLAAFAVIGCLLLLHLRTGLRGRQAARLALTAYLLISLGYPGVKFVSDVLLG